jgi:hypothetical protein
LFVHGGIDWKTPIEEQYAEDMMWDRHMVSTAIQWENYNLLHPTDKKLYFRNYKEIYVGHSST